LKVYAPIKYLRKESLPSLASQILLLSLQVRGRSLKTSEIVAVARQSKREDLSAARAKASKKRGTQRKDSISSVKTPSLHTLIAQPGSRSGAAPPDGEASQGPSPVDYNLKIEADFPKELMLTMQENTAKKARRTVIGRTFRGKATFKTLLDCLKLHLPAPPVSTTLLTRGYFEILFEDEEGAKTTRRLTVVEWSDLRLSFSRYIPNFNASSQGAEAQLSPTQSRFNSPTCTSNFATPKL
jgi:hypothetical protein